MSFWPSVAPRLLAADRAFLEENEPGRSWPEICDHLGRLLGERVAEHTREYFDRPDDWTTKWTAPSDGPAGSSTETIPSEGRFPRVTKVWQVLRHWWRIAVEAWGTPQSAQVVLDQLRAGRGFSPGPTGRDLPAEQQPNLKGDPVADILLADAVTEHAPRAIRLLEARFEKLAEAIAGRRGISDSQWWPTCHSNIVVGRRLRDYAGHMGLAVFLGRILSRERSPLSVERKLTNLTATKQWHCLLEVLGPARAKEVEEELLAAAESDPSKPETLSDARKVAHVSRLLLAQEQHRWRQRCDDLRETRIRNVARGSQESEIRQVETSDCLRFWEPRVRTAFDHLTPREVVSVYLRKFASWPLLEAAQLLGVDEGNVSRATKKGLEKLQAELKALVGRDDPQTGAALDCLRLLLSQGISADGLLTLGADQAIRAPGPFAVLEIGFLQMDTADELPAAQGASA